MIRVLLGRFFRHCIKLAENPRRIQVHQLEPDYMTDGEISQFIHGRGYLIDWDVVAARKKAGARVSRFKVAVPAGPAGVEWVR